MAAERTRLVIADGDKDAWGFTKGVAGAFGRDTARGNGVTFVAVPKP